MCCVALLCSLSCGLLSCFSSRSISWFGMWNFLLYSCVAIINLFSSYLSMGHFTVGLPVSCYHLSTCLMMLGFQVQILGTVLISPWSNLCNSCKLHWRLLVLHIIHLEAPHEPQSLQSKDIVLEELGN